MPQVDPTAIIDAAQAPEAPAVEETALPQVPDIPPVPEAPQALDTATIDGIPVKKYMELKHREQDQRRHVQALEQELQRYRQPQQTPEMPDPLVDPHGYAQYVAEQNAQVTGQIQQAIQEERYASSEDRARDKFGDDKVEEAIAAFEAMPESPEKRLAWQQFHATRHPWGALVQWHDHQTIVNGIAAAGDQDAWIEQRYAELQARRAGQNGQAPTGASRPASPPPGTPFRGGPPRRAPAPSLSNAPPTAARTSSVLSGPGASFDTVFGDRK